MGLSRERNTAGRRTSRLLAALFRRDLKTRVNPLIALALVTGFILALAVGLHEVVYTLGGVVSVFLMLSILFNLYGGPKR